MLNNPNKVMVALRDVDNATRSEIRTVTGLSSWDIVCATRTSMRRKWIDFDGTYYSLTDEGFLRVGEIIGAEKRRNKYRPSTQARA